MKRSTPIITTLLALTLSLPAMALLPQQQGLYFGLNVGYGKVMERLAGSARQDNSGFGGSVNMGYQINKFFAPEIGFTMYPVEQFDGGVKGNNNYAMHAAIKGIMPFGDTGFTLFGKLGGAVVNHKLVGTTNAGAHMRPALYSALGGSYAITRNLWVTAQAAGTSKNKSVPAMYLISGGVTYMLPYAI